MYPLKIAAAPAAQAAMAKAVVGVRVEGVEVGVEVGVRWCGAVT
jgi:hypothetical protein